MLRLNQPLLNYVGGVILLFITSNVMAFDAFLPLPKRPPIPEDNLPSDKKEALGKQLYFDPRLSINGRMSCNSCHNVMAGGEDGHAFSVGALGKQTKRSAPTVWNVAYQTAYYWDGRAPSLEQLIKDHLLSPTAMAMTDESELMQRLALIPDYGLEFDRAFKQKEALTYDNVSKVIATYIRTLVTPNSPFDTYLQDNKKAISKEAIQGYNDFIETGCAACHFWINFSGPVPGLSFKMGEGFYELFPNYKGSQYDKKYKLTKDPGRYKVTKQKEHKYLWRVPTLRNIALTAPYFHNGSVDTLEEAIRVMAKTQMDKELTEQQISAISEFLNTLSGEFPKQTLPRLPGMPNATVDYAK